MIKQQTAQFVAGNLQEPRLSHLARAGSRRLFRQAIRCCARRLRPRSRKLTLDDVKQYHAATVRPDLTTIVVIGDVTPEEAKAVIEKWFGDWKAAGPKPNTTLPPIPVNKPSAANVPDRRAVQDTVTLAEQLDLNRFDPDYYPLQLGNHVLGGGFYATRLYHDLRQVTGYVYNVDVSLNASKDTGELFGAVRLRPAECVEGAGADRSRPGTDADGGCLAERAAPGQGAAAASDSAERLERGCAWREGLLGRA